AHDDGNPEEWDVHHWQNVNPVHTEALVQLTCGGPQIIYHGGLLHVRVRYYDVEARRPGLPPDVGALVEGLDARSLTLNLANTSPLRSRRVVLQAGAFGEHRFTEVTDLSSVTPSVTEVSDKWFEVHLAPSATLRLRLGMARYANAPSYAQPPM
ncbi:MAG: hypothetical protein V1772_13110, partial [Chloroflexota bacterium]